MIVETAFVRRVLEYLEWAMRYCPWGVRRQVREVAGELRLKIEEAERGTHSQ